MTNIALLAPAPKQAADTRRATVRALTSEVLRGIRALAEMHGGDTIALIVFTGVWVGNTQHLTTDPSRYAELYDIPPDSQRRPLSMEALQRSTGVPIEILEIYVPRLIDRGLLEALPGGGLVAPSAVFTSPQMIGGANEVYTRAMSIVNVLRTAGFSFSDQA